MAGWQQHVMRCENFSNIVNGEFKRERGHGHVGRDGLDGRKIFVVSVFLCFDNQGISILTTCMHIIPNSL